ncbi:LytR/AlgR family response regulator transcription factor [Anaerotruncus rubiinfantis]|uniref:LytR/AlgR family response regulator transcription factor n=1 Tax=Anaerotruncus rubiinfantis TaxID=1720200 RepID=UPI000832CB76|nr:LytTR family DNA-binding domain-containing protein [Anaerotruncus rubiinfantis]
MRIAIIDDERPSRSELKHLILQTLPDAEIDEADSGAEAVELVSGKKRYDALFVDVHLGDMEGTTLSLMLKKLQPHAQIVFATAYDAYAVKAFEIDAADYIVKPFDPKRVAQALAKIQGRLAPSCAPEPPKGEAALGKLSILCEKRMVLVDIPSIAYIETDTRSCVLHTKDGDYTSAQPLGYFEKKLVPAGFFRSHKSYLINLEYVTEIYPWFNGMLCVKLRGYENENLPVSRKNVKSLKEIFEG